MPKELTADALVSLYIDFSYSLSSQVPMYKLGRSQKIFLIIFVI